MATDSKKYQKLAKALNKGVGAALSAAAPRSRKSGGGFYSEKWSPPRSYTENGQDVREPPETIALVEGQYRIEARSKEGDEIEFEFPFWLYYDHYNASSGIKRRSCACSAGLVVDLDENGNPKFEVGNDPCVPCYYIDEEGAGGNEGWLTRRRMAVFTAVVLKWFHSVNDGKYTTFEDCTGKNCKLCSKGSPRQFGRRVFWSMGPQWAEYIYQKQDLLRRSCGCGGELEYLGFTCPNCKNVVRDFESGEPEEGEIESLLQDELECPKCEETVVAEPEVECSECDKPQLVNLWNIAMRPRRVGEKYTPEIENWRPLKDKEIDAIKQFEPIDFSKFLSPSSVAEQADRYGLKNPFAKDRSGSSEW